MKKIKKSKFRSNIVYSVMALPGMLALLLFTFVPCYGLLLAFKEYNYAKGILGSPWAGFDNFIAIFKTDGIWRLLRNTIFYNITWTLLVNIILAMIVAIMLYDVRNKYVNKVFQTCMLIPAFVSTSALAYATYTLLSHDYGLINQVLEFFGKEAIQWYNEAQYWPVILTLVNAFANVGMASLYFYSAMLNIDIHLFEAASIDGAGKFKQIWYVVLPELMPMAAMVLILRMGSVVSSGVEPFYSLTLNSSALYETTDVLGTYLFRGLSGTDIGVNTAISLAQNLVGIILVVTTNKIVKKINSDMALY